VRRGRWRNPAADLVEGRRGNGTGCAQVVNIQSAMLVLLGFLAAVLLGLLLAPAYWRRAVRLTTFRLKQAMPLTEAEIRADKDRLRAEYAIKVHRLESKAEQAAHDAARQQIELSRRDAAISNLEGEIGRLTSALEEHENAHRVLEQTITDRLPKLEQRYVEARKLLAEREQELAGLNETAQRQARALEEAAQVNAQQRGEAMRANSALAALSARTREGLADPKFDAEVALRTEIETLKEKLAQQAQLVAQMKAGDPFGRAAAAAIAIHPPAPPADEEVVSRARREMDAVQAARQGLETELASARRTLEDRDVEIAGIKAALAAYERGSKDERTMSVRDSRIAMKVRIGALQAEAQQQSATIQRLRSELAGANERLAKQASHFMAEMRRLGTGGVVPPSAVPAAGEVSRSAGDAVARPHLAPRLAALTRPVASVMSRAREGAIGQTLQDTTRVRGFLKALGGSAAVRGAAKVEAAAAAAIADEPAAVTAGGGPDDRPRRLSERIAGATKSGQ
jgi:hypothetical protein